MSTRSYIIYAASWKKKVVFKLSVNEANAASPEKEKKSIYQSLDLRTKVNAEYVGALKKRLE